MSIRNRALLLACVLGLLVISPTFAHGAKENKELAGISIDALPVTMPVANQACSASLEDAARAALTVAMALDGRYEWGGVILLRPNVCYQFTGAVTNEHPTAVRYRIGRPQDAQVVGLYHTHPARLVDGHKFSPSDMATVREMKLPSFIGVPEGRQIRLLNPGFRNPTSMRSVSAVIGHEGVLVGKL